MAPWPQRKHHPSSCARCAQPWRVATCVAHVCMERVPVLLVAYQDLEGVAEDALREHAALSLGEPRSTRSWTLLPSQACLCTTLQVPERRRVVVLYAFCTLQNLHRVERVQVHLLARLGALLRPAIKRRTSDCIAVADSRSRGPRLNLTPKRKVIRRCEYAPPDARRPRGARGRARRGVGALFPIFRRKNRRAH